MHRALPLLALSLAACGGPLGDGTGDGVVEADEVVEIGWTAEIVGAAHDVAGTAELTDDRTIEIRDWTYDGGGVDARFFLIVNGGAFFEDFQISDNQVGEDADGTTLTLTIPDDVPDDGWDTITLWCVPFAASFGAGVFAPPEG